MEKFHTAQICLNGHMINDKSDSNSAFNEKYCSKCGQPTITHCPVCNTKIRGSYNFEGLLVAYQETPVPKYCHECGSAYPWTQSILDNAVELLALDINLDADIKKTIQEAIPNLITETPSTPIAVQKYKTSMEHASEIVKEGLFNLLKDVVTEGIKTLLFPHLS